MTKVIKRYANRKLYDTEQSSYVTLDEIQLMVKNGEDLQVIDNKSGEDLTNQTLAQIIYEQEKAQKKLLPVSAFRHIIQSGEDFVTKIQSPVNQFRDEVRQKANVIGDGKAAVKEFIDTTQTSLDEMQRRVDDRLKDAVDHMTHVPEMRREIFQLETRMIELENRIKELEKKLVIQTGTDVPNETT